MDVANGCHDMLIMSMNLNYTTVLNFHGVDYCCIIDGISKGEAINILQNVD